MNDKLYNIASVDEIKTNTSTEYKANDAIVKVIPIIEIDDTLPKDTSIETESFFDHQNYDNISYLMTQKVKAKRYILRK